MDFGNSETGLTVYGLFLVLEDGGNAAQLRMLRDAVIAHGHTTYREGYEEGAEAMRRLLLEKVDRTKTDELTEET